MKLIDKSALVAEIEKLKGKISDSSSYCNGWQHALRMLELSLNTLEVKEVDLEKEWKKFLKDGDVGFKEIAKHFFELGIKAQHDNWKVVDDINLPQADRKKIYCVLSKNKYLLARVIDHPHDELLQWKCTEFPFHCYDMCEGDKYMQIV